MSLRNRVTAFLFGKYNVNNIATELMIREEEFITSFENIYYDEVMLVSSVGIFLMGILLSVYLSPFFLLLLLPPFLLVYFALELEIVFLTNERLFIEKKGIIEKILRVRNIQTVSLEQIAILQYRRAPINYPGLTFALVMLGLGILPPILVTNGLTILIAVPIVAVSLYLFWFSLRLSKRSIELNIIGVQNLMGIGRTKGAPMWFLKELQQLVFERIHHYEKAEYSNNSHRVLLEYPLMYPEWVKDLIQKQPQEVEREMVRMLFEESGDFNSLVERCREFTPNQIEQALRKLKTRGIIYFSDKKKWEIVPHRNS